jgi:two-component system NtrC family sensor kinase
MSAPLSRWELAAETIAVKIRWFGILLGYLLVNLGDARAERGLLNAILALGVVYALVDSACSFRGQIFLGRWPLLISAMEAVFIALLCFCHIGVESPFRYYYILSLICCAIRHSPQVTWATWALHSASFLTLYVASPLEAQKPLPLVLTLVILGWVTWASVALASLLKRVGDHLGRLNAELEENRAQLEARVLERTRQLQEAQAHVLHQEKMAAFGLLAAGIAHEVGNPLTSISALVQMLQRHSPDGYSQEKLALVSGQLQRIQITLRELVNFSRPASNVRSRVPVAQVLAEALNIAKYYKRARAIATEIPSDLPPVLGVRDRLVQVFLNLILNAIDATAQGGSVSVKAMANDQALEVEVSDTGAGIASEQVERIFQPYFTTKKHGTGLGLFVTRELVHDHGGTITFVSRPGFGTSFCVRLPVAESAPVISGERGALAPC